MKDGQWWDVSWNPVTGCTPISEGCDNCWAKRMANRLRGRFGYPEDEPFRVTVHDEVPFWQSRLPGKRSTPKIIFTGSMTDLFHPKVEGRHVARILSVARAHPWHTFVILTKRADRMALFCLDHLARSGGMEMWGISRLPPNVWLGVTVENQARADERIPLLLKIPAARRFVSYEPALGSVDFSGYLGRAATKCVVCGLKYGHDAQIDVGTPHSGCRGLDWIIAGGESGPGARPAHPDWFRRVRDDCQAAGVPFMFKQWGEFCAPSQMPEETFRQWDFHHGTEGWNREDPTRWRVGKKRAGRELDGRTWDEVPWEATE